MSRKLALSSTLSLARSFSLLPFLSVLSEHTHKGQEADPLCHQEGLKLETAGGSLLWKQQSQRMGSKPAQTMASGARPERLALQGLDRESSPIRGRRRHALEAVVAAALGHVLVRHGQRHDQHKIKAQNPEKYASGA